MAFSASGPNNKRTSYSLTVTRAILSRVKVQGTTYGVEGNEHPMQTHVILLAYVKMQPFSRARKLQPVTCPITYVIHVRRGIISANVTRSKTRQRQARENMKLMQSASECVGKLPLLETCTIHLPMTCRKSSGFDMLDKKPLFGK